MVGIKIGIVVGRVLEIFVGIVSGII